MLPRSIEKCYIRDLYKVKYQVPETKIFTSEHLRVEDIANRLKRNQLQIRKLLRIYQKSSRSEISRDDSLIQFADQGVMVTCDSLGDGKCQFMLATPAMTEFRIFSLQRH